MKKYRSRFGWVFLIVMGILLFLLITQILTNNLTEGFVLLTVFGLMVHLSLTTYYTISEDTVEVHCSFLIHQSISINNINSISQVYDMFWAPALSFNRLVIRYDQTKSITVSPFNTKGFTDHLLQINPAIELNGKI